MYIHEVIQQLSESDRLIFEETGGVVLDALDTAKEGVRIAHDLVKELYVDLFRVVREQVVLSVAFSEDAARHGARQAFIMEAMQAYALQRVGMLMQGQGRDISPMSGEVEGPSTRDMLAMLLPFSWSMCLSSRKRSCGKRGRG